MLKIENNIAPEYLIDLSRQEMSRLLVPIYFRYIYDFKPNIIEMNFIFVDFIDV